ncbi:MAG: AAA family ATPase, partial [Pseudomonadota bacterium]
IKSGKTGTLKSLMQFIENADHPWAIRLYAGQLQKDSLRTPSGKKFYLLSLPYYLITQLTEYIALLIENKI